MSENRRGHPPPPPPPSWHGRGFPPPPAPFRKHPVLVVAPVGTLRVLALADQTVGLLVHWDHDGRVMRRCHKPSRCHWCDYYGAVLPLWVAYLPVAWGSPMRLATLAVPRAAYEGCPDFRSREGNLRGSYWSLRRSRTTRNGPVVAKFLGTHADPASLPAAWDAWLELTGGGVQS